MMTAKEYLSQAFYLEHRIDSKAEQIESLNLLATKCTATLTGMPHNPNRGQSTMADAVCKIVDLQVLLNNDISELVALLHQIRDVIESIEDNEYKTVLEKRYLCHKKWEEIAVLMGYDLRYLYKLHNRALEAVKIPA